MGEVGILITAHASAPGAASGPALIPHCNKRRAQPASATGTEARREFAEFSVVEPNALSGMVDTQGDLRIGVNPPPASGVVLDRLSAAVT